MLNPTAPLNPPVLSRREGKPGGGKPSPGARVSGGQHAPSHDEAGGGGVRGRLAHVRLLGHIGLRAQQDADPYQPSHQAKVRVWKVQQQQDWILEC
jgi:hypothetical protein